MYWEIMTESKKDLLMKAIMKKVNHIDVAGYLKIEVEDFLKYLHYYKLKNILQNIGTLPSMTGLYGKGLDSTGLRKFVRDPANGVDILISRINC